uniref:Uncharacterized protein n=1 Tax=Hyaloperonospora arabidopsidis (strain Emoy2) TaxID=559515 RepID=M4BSX4_HYAAE
MANPEQRLHYKLVDTAQSSFMSQRGSVTIEGSVEEFWQTGLRQIRAVANREHRRANTKFKERVC